MTQAAEYMLNTTASGTESVVIAPHVVESSLIEDMHEEGARRFGQQWFLANKTVVRIAKKNYIDPTRNQKFLASIAFALCEAREAKP